MSLATYRANKQPDYDTQDNIAMSRFSALQLKIEGTYGFMLMLINQRKRWVRHGI